LLFGHHVAPGHKTILILLIQMAYCNYL